MKRVFFLLFVTTFCTSYSQYSNYYDIDVKQKVDVTGNVNVNKIIRTIDYGQLAIANAQREKNRLEKLKYADERERNIYLSVAGDPVMAFEYGKYTEAVASSREAKGMGFKKITLGMTVPHKSLFVSTGDGRFENVSSDGILTEVIFELPTYNFDNIEYDPEKNAKLEQVNVGEIFSEEDREFFVHNKDVNRATVYGV